MQPFTRLLAALAIVLSIGLALPHPAAGQSAVPAEVHGAGEAYGRALPLWSILPFAGILLSIALFPLFARRFWHHRYPLVSLFWALLFAVPFLAVFRRPALHAILDIYLQEYLPFIILLWGLFTISGGIVVRGRIRGTPALNTVLLFIGTVIASWIGTTGASMLLIRPVLRSNEGRKRKTHIVVFFIFLVSNIGGSLTPLGDPPLFLGFLEGVPFFWTLRLLPETGLAAAVLLGLFYLLDKIYYALDRKAGLTIEAPGAKGPVRIGGLYNLVFFGGIVGAVLLSGVWHAGTVEVYGIPLAVEALVRDGVILAMAFLSLAVTPSGIRKDNEFDWEPIREVAILFAGIFMTIIPAIAILRAGAEGHLAFLLKAVREPAHYFWATGTLSSFLDNAPTYLTFFNASLGTFYGGMPGAEAVHALCQGNRAVYLEAISLGAVFMGANSYIGNAPNFMVKSIAEEWGVKMPSFFGYIVKYTCPILVPLFLLVTFLFLLH
jgi:Na+/H+ antiporter NhaD/arsenite permease-like protein